MTEVKKKRKRLKPAVKKAILGTIGMILAVSFICTVYFTATLQSSYKNSPPTEQEAAEIRSNPISNWLFGKYIIDEEGGK